jgi:hypothetical protein
MQSKLDKLAADLAVLAADHDRTKEQLKSLTFDKVMNQSFSLVIHYMKR